MKGGNNMVLAALSQEWLIILIILLTLLAIGGIVLLYIFVILPSSYKKQFRNLQKRFSYLDSKLIGQDSQYIHRIEIISRTNLLYLDKYETFLRRFKSIYETEDKYSESMIKQLNSLLGAKQYKNIKNVISETKKALNVLEESVNSLDADLYQVIKLEEDARKQINDLKESYRHVRQTYYAESGDIEMTSATFGKMFDKIDATFSTLDEAIESAEYDEINTKIPELNNVLLALGKVLVELPTLCSLTKTVVAEKIVEIQNKYKETEQAGVPLYHIGFKARLDDWKKRLSELNKRIVNLQCTGVHTECDLILAEINTVGEQLDNEIEARQYFRDNYETIYRCVNDVQKTFIKLTSLLPQIEEIYLLGDEQKEKFKELSSAITKLGNSKRYLDGFVLSGIRQPYSLLKTQLDELKADYEVVNTGVEQFKEYIDSLKTTAEEAYKLIYVYYLRVKEIEKVIADMDVEEVAQTYKEKIDAVYDVLNYIYTQIQTRPINVEEIASKIDQLNNISNAMFEEIDTKARLSSLAELSIVLLNPYRKMQDINQSLDQFEASFFKGDFENIYTQASNLYRNIETLQLNEK